MKRLRYFLKYAFQFKTLILLSLLLILVDVTITTVMPWFMSEIIDRGVLAGSMETVKRLSLLMVLIAFVGSLSSFFFSAAASVFSQRMSNRMRKDLFRNIHSLSYGQTDQISSGTLLTRVMSDTQIVTQFGAAFFQMLVKPGLLFVFGFVMVLIFSGSYAWIFAVAIPLQVLILILFMKRLTPLFLSIQLRIEKINSRVQETLTNLRLIKSYVHQDHENRNYREDNDDLLKLNLKIQYSLAVMNPLIMLIVNFVMIAVIAMSSRLVSRSGLEIGDVMAVIMYIQQIIMSLMMIGQIYQATAKTLISCGRLEEIQRMKPTLPDGTKELLEPVQTLEARDISFFYPGAGEGSKPALSHISFRVPAGSFIGITGPTGSGKSTLVSLLARFAAASSGMVLLNDTDILEWSSSSVGRKIAVALQKSALCAGTIEENIRYGMDDVSPEEVRFAASVAQADAFISAMPDGYGTDVTQSGASLSGGQKQCIALARSLLRKPDVLILDDSTSSMDLITESRFHVALREHYPALTLIVVSQRIHSILRADRILLLENGCLSASGTHQELQKQSALYSEICRVQEIGEVIS